MPETQTAPKDGATLIAEERRRQIEQEGWTPEHDDEWDRHQLVGAAVCYALEGIALPAEMKRRIDRLWCWSAEWWKPKDRIRDLVRAGALIAAEIDRLQRAGEVS